jgi:hypothetical protein
MPRLDDDRESLARKGGGMTVDDALPSAEEQT